MLPVVLAQEATGGGASLILLVVMVAVFWFFIIRPQRKRAKAQQELAESLEIGDHIQTVGGIKGVVVALDGDDVVLGVEEGRLRVTRRAVGSRSGDSETTDGTGGV